MIFWLQHSNRDRIEQEPERFCLSLEKRLSSLSAMEHFELAVAQERLGLLDKAERSCRLALQKQLIFNDCFFALALLCFRQSKFKAAQRWFIRALHAKKSDPSPDVFNIEQKLKAYLSPHEANHWGLWCLNQLSSIERASEASQFEIGKLLFERSDYEGAVQALSPLAKSSQFGYEVGQYLSYIYERLYRGEELIVKTLELAETAVETTDLFFNLAMIFQHDEANSPLSLHFFYLAREADPNDPGLRFSLEQACLEYIGSVSKPRNIHEHYFLMVAHLYHGSLAMAERYATSLREEYEISGEADLRAFHLSDLWDSWLMKEGSLFSEAIAKWFSKDRSVGWALKAKRQKTPTD